MLDRIISFSVQNKLIIGLFIAGLVVYGSYQFTRLPIDAVPDITDNQVQVITVVPSLGAPEIERLITFPIEQALSNIPGIKEMRSFSRFGLSLITVVFEDDTDIYWARQQVTERLKSAEEQIPKGMGSPVLAPVTTGLGEIYQYVIRAKPGFENLYDDTELRTIQDWIVRRQLLGVKGVADVSSFGGRLKQIEIAVDVKKLQSFRLTVQDIFHALEENNENTGGAYIERNATVLYIRSDGLIKNIQDIKNIVLKNTTHGNPLLMGDVAEVRTGSAIRYGAMTYNGEGEAAGAVVLMLKGGNSNLVIKDVKERITQIEKTLPEGVVIEPFLDRSKMVNSSIGTVATNLLEGALIVVFVLVLFLGNLRAGFLVASVIPLSMFFAVIMMNIFGVSGNLMSLGALDFGLIVDGAVIIVEAVMHTLVARSMVQNQWVVSQKEMEQTVTHSTGKMMKSAVFGQIIILVVYLPIFTLEGIEGKMFMPMAQTVAFALLGAFILSLTYIPMMSSLFLKKEISSNKNISDIMMDFLIRIQQRMLFSALKFPGRVLGFSLGIFVASWFVFSSLGGEFIPELPEGDFAVETRVLPGSNLTTTIDACLKASQILKTRFPEVEKVVGKIGSGEIPVDPMPMEAADLMIILKDKNEWTSAETWNELSEKMSEALEEIPGVTFSFQYPVAMRFNELMTGAKQDVVCKIFGENLDTLSKYSKLLGNLAGKVDGAKEIYVEPLDGLPQLIISHKREAIAAFGLDISTINRVVNTSFAGEVSGQMVEDEKRFDLVVRLGKENRQSPEDVANLMIPTPQGNQVPLSQLADVSIQESINQIQREDAKRRIVVGFNVSGRDVQSIVKDLKNAVDQNLKLPPGYYIKYGGAFENLEAAKQRLFIAVPVSLLLIFIFLYFAFGSVRQGLLIYSAIPLSAIGGILFLAMRGMPFSISAGIGFIALFGVAVLNGIVLLAEFNRLKQGGQLGSRRVVLLGTRHRLRPVLMTAFVASLGFLPMALSQGAGAEVQRPLATVVIGGLLFATFLTLFVLPVLYILFEKEKHMNAFKNLTKGLSVAGLLLFKTSAVSAQELISLDQALETARGNNLNLSVQKKLTVYRQQLVRTAFELPHSEISAAYGQINSAFSDNLLGASQMVAFPTFYSRQKTLLKEIHQTAQLNETLSDAELSRAVSMSYYEILFLESRKKILMESHSLLEGFSQRISLLFENGETGILEKVTAESQRDQVNRQMAEIENQLNKALITFRWLLNTEKEIKPSPEFNRLIFAGADTLPELNGHPILMLQQQNQEISRASIQLEKSKLLPSLRLGYQQMTMQGTGNDNITYTSAQRFHSFQLGLGFPLIGGAQRSKVKAAKTMEESAEIESQAKKSELNAKYSGALRDYQLKINQARYFEEKGLPQAKIITETADQTFKSGNISYLEWMQLFNHAVSIKSQYEEAIYELNLSIIELNYLTTK